METLEQKVDKTLSQYVNKEEVICLALSGGVDSVALYNIVENLGYNVQPILFNHKLRKESDTEELLLKARHENLIVGHWENPTSDENSAREARYAFFNKVMDELNTKYLLVGHHMNDVAENFLQRLVKGSTVKGLSSFNVVGKGLLEGDRYILRPLIKCCLKEELYNYAKENHLIWFEDHTNATLDYARNRYRNKIIPMLEQENCKAVEHVNTIANDLADLEELLNSKVEDLVAQYKTTTILGRDALKHGAFSTNNLLNKELIKYLVNLDGSMKMVTSDVLKDLVEFVLKGEPNTRYLVSKGKYLFIDWDGETKVVIVMYEDDFTTKLTEEELNLLKNSVIQQDDVVFVESKKVKLDGNKRVKDWYKEMRIPHYLRMKNVVLYNKENNKYYGGR